ncbi:hypothetical protein HII36_29995 [Nonomuraea sp. NN258]|uniref:hypothetical protein n=1 Tax=Nonomuraea antri TaxID=2730852 RepID=UPI00156A483B|nr:hypothetical protein [Nonomuraea antri]NRQ36034.1 hypothetical protein [Nonomuraea antri]
MGRSWRTLAVLAVLAAASCSAPDPGPTAAQAGQTLKSHIGQLMRLPRLHDVAVTDPGGADVACGAGGVKRTYAAGARFDGDPELLVDLLTGRMTGTWGYRVERVFIPDSVKTVLRLAPARVTVTLDVPADDRATITGETDCVPAPR